MEGDCCNAATCSRPADGCESGSSAIRRPEVSLSESEGLYPGMFGKLRLRLGERFAILVPEPAVFRVGQLTTLRVLVGDRWERRYVTVGAEFEGRREILSGLSADEIVGWD